MNKGKGKSRPKILRKQVLLPDLLALPPEDLRIEKSEEKGQIRSLLRLSQSFGNIGRGRLQVRRGNSTPSCPGRGRAVGYQDVFYTDGSKRSLPLKECMIYHPVHRHWHVANIARYDLCEIDTGTGEPGKVLVSSDKISFCLIDEHRIGSPQYLGPRYVKRYVSCLTRTSGISPGWADEYDYKVYGQWIDITGIKDGIYFVKTTVNPQKLFVEKTHHNNVAWVKIRISDDGEDVTIVD